MPAGSDENRVLIVGAGVIGIACAHYLSKAGYRVTVVDQGKIAAACSRGNCGYVCPSHVLPLTEPAAIKLALKSLCRPDAPFRVKPSVGIKHLNWFLQFARRCNQRQMLAAGKQLKTILDSSLVEYRKLIFDENIACEWQESGLLYVFQTKAGMEEFAQTDRFLSQHFDVNAMHIPGKDLADFEPALRAGLAGAYYYGGDASLRPDMLNQSWVSLLTNRGVEFKDDCGVKQVERTDGVVSAVHTSQGTLVADHFVFALGAWSPELSDDLGCKLPVQPGKGYSVTMSRPEQCPMFPMLFPEHKVGVSPFENGYRLGSMMEFYGYDTSISPRRIEQLRRSAEPYLTTPHTTEEYERWYGWRPMTWDSLPIIGPVPNTSNAHVATGHNMLGLSLATATGKLISEMVSGQPTHIPVDAFRVERF